MKLCEHIWNDTMKNSRNFGDDLGFLRWVNEQRNTMIVVAWPVHGAGTAPEAFMLAFYHHSPTFIDLFMVKVLIRTRMVAFMKKNSDEYEDIDQGVLNSDMPTGGLFASC